MKTVLNYVIAAGLCLGVATSLAAACEPCADSLIRSKNCANFQRNCLELKEATMSDLPNREFSRSINRDFPTSASGMTALYNRYGMIEVKTWNENRVKIDITILVNANDQRAADRIFDRINVNFTSTVGFIKAETVINEGSYQNQEFKINYVVWMPISNQLDLRNRYGNSFVSQLNGKLLAEIKYGDLKTDAIKNDADLTIEYGKAVLTSTQNLTGQVGYGGINVDQTANVTMDSRYSNVTLRRASDVRLTSKYDEIGLGVIQDLRLQTKYSTMNAASARAAFVTSQYSDLNFKNIVREIDADLQYGELGIEQVSKGFQNINVMGQHSNVDIGMERGCTYRFQVASQCTQPSLPSGAVQRRRVANGTSSDVEGYLGDANAKAFVKVNLKYGDLSIH
jgi:hypothetical protein